MSGRRFIPFVLLSVVTLVLTGCQASDQQNKQAENIDKLSQQLDVMQQELRLVTKEVVGLSAKLDGLKNSPVVNARSGNTRRSTAPQSVLLDGDLNKSPRLGSEKAEYAMIEFSDYECPYCMRYAKQVFPKIKQRYIDSGKLQYVVRDFPLGFHSQAKPAAIAADCAAEQSKFWDMNDALVKNSRKLSKELYPRLAKEIGLDEGAFNECLVDPKIAARIDADLSYGQSVGVTGTPRFYIGKIKNNSIVNVVQVSGARPLKAFDRAIQEAMSKG